MHGKFIALISPDCKDSVKNHYDEILYAIGADYIGDMLYGHDAMAIFESFRSAITTIDVGTLSVKDAVEFTRDYPVVILNGGVEIFKSFVQFKASCEHWKERFNEDFEYLYEYGWEVWDFHF